MKLKKRRIRELENRSLLFIYSQKKLNIRFFLLFNNFKVRAKKKIYILENVKRIFLERDKY